MIGAASSMSRISGRRRTRSSTSSRLRQQPHRALVDREPAERTEPGVGFDRVDHRAQARAEVGVAEVVAAGAAARLGEQLRPRRTSMSSVAT